MRGRAIGYTAEELAWIEDRKALPRRQLHIAFVGTFDRPDVSQANLTALCKRKGWATGRNGRFHSGHEAWNKGKPMPSHPNSCRTQFRKGREPHNTRHLGHERTSKDGYVEVSIARTNPHTGYGRRYVQKHRHLWVEANGPVPDGHALKSLDGDKTNTDPANWVAIPRAMLPRLNGRFGRNYDSAPSELKPAIMAIVRLEHAEREKRKDEARTR